jgi:phage terminase large subunit GpA-like protein
VVLTEVDKMDQPGKGSRESDPITQFEGRSKSFGDRALVYGECTFSTKLGRIYREIAEFGTDTRVWIPCPHCGEYVWCDRKSFGGWQEAADLPTARARAHFTCPRKECAAIWTEADRAAANRSPVLASSTQTVARDGTVSGSPPSTNTFGFHWNAMHNLLVTQADIGEAEFRAERSGSMDDKKALDQFTWAEPHEEELVDLSALTKEVLFRKITQHPRGVVPDGTARITVFIDLGLYRCWWMAAAWLPDAQGHVIDYGSLEVPQDRQKNPLAILGTLNAFREEVLKYGWKAGTGTRAADLVLVDSGWQRDIAYKFVKDSGHGYLASKGLGSGRDQQRWRNPAPGPGRQVGRDWVIMLQPDGTRLVDMHADYWKRQVHAGFAAAPGAPGSLSLYHCEPREHLGFIRQITAEREEEEFVAGRGAQVYWNRLQKDNHYLDCAYGARAAADMLGIRLIEDLGKPPPRPAAAPAGDVRHPVRWSKFRRSY